MSKKKLLQFRIEGRNYGDECYTLIFMEDSFRRAVIKAHIFEEACAYDEIRIFISDAKDNEIAKLYNPQFEELYIMRTHLK